MKGSHGWLLGIITIEINLLIIVGFGGPYLVEDYPYYPIS